MVSSALKDQFYHCGGWQLFNRMYELVKKRRDAELITYRHREEGHRYLDDVGRGELESGILWIYWLSHVTELAERLNGHRRAVLYAMNTDYGKFNGQVTPEHWPIVCLSRYIAAKYSIFEPWRFVNYLGPVLHEGARNYGRPRDIDVLVHTRKTNDYVKHALIPVLKKSLRVEVIDNWKSQESFLELLNRSKAYLYWVHKQIPGMWIREGFGMQPLEAIVCGSTPVANVHGGMSDYLEAPWNCYKIGVHSLEYDILQITRAVNEHTGRNADEDRLRQLYGVETFYEHFDAVEKDLLFYFENCPGTPPGHFAIDPPQPPLYRRPYVWTHRQFWRRYKALKGIRPH